jgi:hypothetical protein
MLISASLAIYHEGAKCTKDPKNRSRSCVGSNFAGVLLTTSSSSLLELELERLAESFVTFVPSW